MEHALTGAQLPGDGGDHQVSGTGNIVLAHQCFLLYSPAAARAAEGSLALWKARSSSRSMS